MAARGNWVNYGDRITFTNRIVDNIEGNNVSIIDNFISPVSRVFYLKNKEITTKVQIEFPNVDNLWFYSVNKSLKSIKNIYL
jgi:hypothetical protein